MASNIVIIVLSIVLSVSVTLLNSGCLFAILYTREQHRVASLLIASLLGSHVIQGIIVIPLYVVKCWEEDISFASDSFLFSYLLTNYMSCLTVLLISLDRFLAIRFPLSYRVHASKSHASRLIVALFFYVLILCLIPFGSRNAKRTYAPSKDWTVFMLLFNTALPFLIIIATYVYISRKSYLFVINCDRRRIMQTKDIRPTPRGRSKSLFLTKEFATAKIAVIIAISYIICWGPSFMYYLLEKLCEHCFSKSFSESQTKKNFSFAMKFLTMIDGLVAPVIYCLRNKIIILSFNQKMSRQRSNIFLGSNQSSLRLRQSVQEPLPSRNRSLSVPILGTQIGECQEKGSASLENQTSPALQRRLLVPQMAIKERNSDQRELVLLQKLPPSRRAVSNGTSTQQTLTDQMQTERKPIVDSNTAQDFDCKESADEGMVESEDRSEPLLA